MIALPIGGAALQRPGPIFECNNRTIFMDISLIWAATVIPLVARDLAAINPI